MGNIVIGTLFILVSLWLVFMGIGLFLDINYDIDILKYIENFMDKFIVIIMPLCIAGIGGMFIYVGILFILGKM